MQQDQEPKTQPVDTKVPFFRSIAAKLFYAITGVGFLIVLGTTANHLYTVRTFLDDRLRDALTSKAKEAAGGINAAIENWRSQITIAAHVLDQESAKAAHGSLVRLIESNREILALQVADQSEDGLIKFVDSVSTPFTAGEAFEGYEARDVLDKLSPAVQKLLEGWAMSSAGKKPVMRLANPSPAVKLPVLTIGLPFARENSKKVRWFVMSVWQNRLISLMPQSASTTTRVTTPEGGLLTSSAKAEIYVKTNLSKSPVFLASQKATAGFLAFAGKGGKEMVGAFAAIQGVNLQVIVEQDPTSARLSTRVVIIQAVLWAWIFVLIAFLASFFGSDYLTRPLRAVTAATTRIAAGDFSTDIDVTSKDEVGVMSRAVESMAVKLEALLRSSVEAARQEKELATAKLVQATFMPIQKIESAGLSVCGFNKPASETGGDIWGHYDLGNGREFLYVADATGHGAAAAFVTAMAHACCMTVLELAKTMPSAAIAPAVASMVNNVLYRTTRSRMAMTFQAFLIDSSTGEVWLTNAGHPFPVVLRNVGTTAPGKEAQFLRVAGNPLGMFDGADYVAQPISLAPGEKIVLYSDGLTEGRSPDGKMLGREKVRKIIAKGIGGDTMALHDLIVADAFTYFAGAEQDDDITIVVAELRVPVPAIAAA